MILNILIKMNKFGKRWLLIQEEPFRLFFPLGILFGMAGTGHWLIYGAGWSESYSGYYHAAVQMWLYMGAFAGGFLMTAIPRFASAPHASAKEILAVLFLMLAMFTLLVSQRWVLSGLAYAAWLLVILSFIVRRFLKKGHAANPPAEFIWIPIAFFHAVAGIGLQLLSQSGLIGAGFFRTGRSMAEQGFVLSLVMGIGGFLGPRLLGLHELSFGGMPACQAAFRQRFFTHLFMGILLFAAFFSELPAAYFARALIVSFELALVSRVLRRPKVPGIFAIFLSVSFWSVIAGVWLASFFTAQRALMLHFLFLGGFSLMTFLIATMVTLSHSGQGEKLGKPLWIFWVIFAGILSALTARVTAPWAPEHYFLHLGIASSLWIFLGAAWLFFALPTLTREGFPEPTIHRQDRTRGLG